jgi:hypothetical protein
VGVSHESIASLRFSPDGQHLAFVAHDNNQAEVIEDGQVVGGKHQSIDFLQFSPDSKDLAFVARDSSGAKVIVVMSLPDLPGLPIPSPDPLEGVHWG